MAGELTDERSFFLSTLPAGRRDRRLAIAVVAASAAIFALAAPFAKVPLAPVAAFIPIYESALVINDLITAVLLFGQFNILRSRALLMLAGGYLFTAFITVAHALTFPGLFSPTGLLGAGSHSTAWLYMFWHGGFPLLVIAYTLLDGSARAIGSPRGSSSVPILSCVAGALLVVAALTLLTTTGQAVLPAIMQGSRYTSAMIGVVSGVWVLSIVALVFLWRRRAHTVLDLWLMVVMCAWIFDIALSAVFNAGRFDLGFYAGRVYGLLASTFVLLVLLLDNGALYARLATAHERRIKGLGILREIDRAIAAEERPEVIAAAVIQPLRELLGVPRAIVNIFDLAAGEVEWLAAAGRRRSHLGPGVRYSIRLMGDVNALRRGEPQVIDTHTLPPGPEVEALLASGVHVYMVMPMIAGGELIGAVSFGGEPAPFHAEQISIAREVSTQLAIAITQARLYARIKKHAEELEQRVQERTSELEAANKELEAFSYSVSHDLRAPLRAVDGYAQMLEEDYSGKLDAEGNRLLGTVRANSRKMGQLIDDLLAFSRLGRAPLKTRAVKMNPLVEQILDELRPEVTGRKIEFAVGALGTVDVDPALIKHVLTNLLSNAIKFTGDRNPAVVEIGCRSETRAGDATVYYVKDNGAGFDMKYYDKLFGVFQRLHSAAEFPGTGVGLAIVQRVIHRHGGKVWAEATPGVGATFYFTLERGREVHPERAPGGAMVRQAMQDQAPPIAPRVVATR
jgi:signal transduction histidine kinase